MALGRSLRVLLMTGDLPLKILLDRALEDAGPTVLSLSTGDKALDQLERSPFDVSRLDFELPDGGRIETRKGRGGDLQVTVSPTRQSRSGQRDEDRQDSGAVPQEFLTLPLKTADLTDVLEQAREQAKQESRARRRRRAGMRPGSSVYGASEAMDQLMSMVERVAAGSASVLIQGETGVGKSLIAREIHALGPRAEQRLVAVNCGAFQEQLLESELFGHEKGAFTGAVSTKPGLFEVAHQGTLFLDEIGEMSPPMQAKLLQVLDGGEMRRVGGTENRKVDVRLVAATNKDLAEEVKAKRFRQDLFFRLNVIQLRVPPLRERRDDIAGLVELFLDRFPLPDGQRKEISPEALRLLENHSWPGNVRELANTIEGLVLLAPGVRIETEDLPPSLRPSSRFQLPDAEAPLPLVEVERLHIQRMLRYTEGKKAPAARALGIDIKTLNNKIKSFGIEL